MNARTLLVGAFVAGAVLPLALGAAAQTRAAGAAAPATAQPQITYGPPIPGICVYSRAAVINTSKVGQSVGERMKQLSAQAEAEIKPEGDQIVADDKKLEANRTTMDAPSIQAAQAQLQLRYSNWQKRRQQIGEELQRTEQQEVLVIDKQLDPILVQLFQQKGCSMLVEAENGGVQIVNPAMDLTPQARAALDLKIQTLPFDRVHLDAQAGAGGPAER